MHNRRQSCPDYSHILYNTFCLWLPADFQLNLTMQESKKITNASINKCKKIKKNKIKIYILYSVSNMDNLG